MPTVNSETEFCYRTCNNEDFFKYYQFQNKIVLSKQKGMLKEGKHVNIKGLLNFKFTSSKYINMHDD